MNDEEIRNSIDVSLRNELFEKVREIHNAPYARLNGIDIISIKQDEVCTKMSLEGKINSIGFAHGAATFAIADHTFAFASNLWSERQTALSCNIVYHRPGIGKELTAVSSKISETRSVSVYSIAVHCDGKHIATATCIGFKIKDKK